MFVSHVFILMMNVLVLIGTILLCQAAPLVDEILSVNGIKRPSGLPDLPTTYYDYDLVGFEYYDASPLVGESINPGFALKERLFDVGKQIICHPFAINVIVSRKDGDNDIPFDAQRFLPPILSFEPQSDLFLVEPPQHMETAVEGKLIKIPYVLVPRVVGSINATLLYKAPYQLSRIPMVGVSVDTPFIIRPINFGSSSLLSPQTASLTLFNPMDNVLILENIASSESWISAELITKDITHIKKKKQESDVSCSNKKEHHLLTGKNATVVEPLRSSRIARLNAVAETNGSQRAILTVSLVYHPPGSCSGIVSKAIENIRKFYNKPYGGDPLTIELYVPAVIEGDLDRYSLMSPYLPFVTRLSPTNLLPHPLYHRLSQLFQETILFSSGKGLTSKDSFFDERRSLLLRAMNAGDLYLSPFIPWDFYSTASTAASREGTEESYAFHADNIPVPFLQWLRNSFCNNTSSSSDDSRVVELCSLLRERDFDLGNFPNAFTLPYAPTNSLASNFFQNSEHLFSFYGYHSSISHRGLIPNVISHHYYHPSLPSFKQMSTFVDENFPALHSQFRSYPMDLTVTDEAKDLSDAMSEEAAALVYHITASQYVRFQYPEFGGPESLHGSEVTLVGSQCVFDKLNQWDTYFLTLYEEYINLRKEVEVLEQVCAEIRCQLNQDLIGWNLRETLAATKAKFSDVISVLLNNFPPPNSEPEEQSNEDCMNLIRITFAGMASEDGEYSSAAAVAVHQRVKSAQSLASKKSIIERTPSMIVHRYDVAMGPNRGPRSSNRSKLTVDSLAVSGGLGYNIEDTIIEVDPERLLMSIKGFGSHRRVPANTTQKIPQNMTLTNFPPSEPLYPRCHVEVTDVEDVQMSFPSSNDTSEMPCTPTCADVHTSPFIENLQCLPPRALISLICRAQNLPLDACMEGYFIHGMDYVVEQEKRLILSLRDYLIPGLIGTPVESKHHKTYYNFTAETCPLRRNTNTLANLLAQKFNATEEANDLSTVRILRALDGMEIESFQIATYTARETAIVTRICEQHNGMMVVTAAEDLKVWNLSSINATVTIKDLLHPTHASGGILTPLHDSTPLYQKQHTLKRSQSPMTRGSSTLGPDASGKGAKLGLAKDLASQGSGFRNLDGANTFLDLDSSEMEVQHPSMDALPVPLFLLENSLNLGNSLFGNCYDHRIKRRSRRRDADPMCFLHRELKPITIAPGASARVPARVVLPLRVYSNYLEEIQNESKTVDVDFEYLKSNSREDISKALKRKIENPIKSSSRASNSNIWNRALYLDEQVETSWVEQRQKCAQWVHSGEFLLYATAYADEEKDKAAPKANENERQNGRDSASNPSSKEGKETKPVTLTHIKQYQAVASYMLSDEFLSYWKILDSVLRVGSQTASGVNLSRDDLLKARTTARTSSQSKFTLSTTDVEACTPIVLSILANDPMVQSLIIHSAPFTEGPAPDWKTKSKFEATNKTLHKLLSGKPYDYFSTISSPFGFINTAMIEIVEEAMQRVLYLWFLRSLSTDQRFNHRHYLNAYSDYLLRTQDTNEDKATAIAHPLYYSHIHSSDFHTSFSEFNSVVSPPATLPSFSLASFVSLRDSPYTASAIPAFVTARSRIQIAPSLLNLLPTFSHHQDAAGLQLPNTFQDCSKYRAVQFLRKKVPSCGAWHDRDAFTIFLRAHFSDVNLVLPQKSDAVSPEAIVGMEGMELIERNIYAVDALPFNAKLTDSMFTNFSKLGFGTGISLNLGPIHSSAPHTFILSLVNSEHVPLYIYGARKNPQVAKYFSVYTTRLTDRATSADEVLEPESGKDSYVIWPSATTKTFAIRINDVPEFFSHISTDTGCFEVWHGRNNDVFASNLALTTKENSTWPAIRVNGQTINLDALLKGNVQDNSAAAANCAWAVRDAFSLVVSRRRNVLHDLSSSAIVSAYKSPLTKIPISIHSSTFATPGSFNTTVLRTVALNKNGQVQIALSLNPSDVKIEPMSNSPRDDEARKVESLIAFANQTNSDGLLRSANMELRTLTILKAYRTDIGADFRTFVSHLLHKSYMCDPNSARRFPPELADAFQKSSMSTSQYAPDLPDKFVHPMFSFCLGAHLSIRSPCLDFYRIHSVYIRDFAREKSFTEYLGRPDCGKAVTPHLDAQVRDFLVNNHFHDYDVPLFTKSEFGNYRSLGSLLLANKTSNIPVDGLRLWNDYVVNPEEPFEILKYSSVQKRFMFCDMKDIIRAWENFGRADDSKIAPTLSCSNTLGDFMRHRSLMDFVNDEAHTPGQHMEYFSYALMEHYYFESMLYSSDRILDARAENSSIPFAIVTLPATPLTSSVLHRIILQNPDPRHIQITGGRLLHTSIPLLRDQDLDIINSDKLSVLELNLGLQELAAKIFQDHLPISVLFHQRHRSKSSLPLPKQNYNRTALFDITIDTQSLCDSLFRTNACEYLAPFHSTSCPDEANVTDLWENYLSKFDGPAPSYISTCALLLNGFPLSQAPDLYKSIANKTDSPLDALSVEEHVWQLLSMQGLTSLSLTFRLSTSSMTLPYLTVVVNLPFLRPSLLHSSPAPASSLEIPQSAFLPGIVASQEWDHFASTLDPKEVRWTHDMLGLHTEYLHAELSRNAINKRQGIPTGSVEKERPSSHAIANAELARNWIRETTLPYSFLELPIWARNSSIENSQAFQNWREMYQLCHVWESETAMQLPFPLPDVEKVQTTNETEALSNISAPVVHLSSRCPDYPASILGQRVDSGYAVPQRHDARNGPNLSKQLKKKPWTNALQGVHQLFLPYYSVPHVLSKHEYCVPQEQWTRLTTPVVPASPLYRHLAPSLDDILGTNAVSQEQSVQLEADVTSNSSMHANGAGSDRVVGIDFPALSPIDKTRGNEEVGIACDDESLQVSMLSSDSPTMLYLPIANPSSKPMEFSLFMDMDHLMIDHLGAETYLDAVANEYHARNSQLAKSLFDRYGRGNQSATEFASALPSALPPIVGNVVVSAMIAHYFPTVFNSTQMANARALEDEMDLAIQLHKSAADMGFLMSNFQACMSSKNNADSMNSLTQCSATIPWTEDVIRLPQNLLNRLVNLWARHRKKGISSQIMDTINKELDRGSVIENYIGMHLPQLLQFPELFSIDSPTAYSELSFQDLSEMLNYLSNHPVWSKTRRSSSADSFMHLLSVVQNYLETARPSHLHSLSSGDLMASLMDSPSSPFTSVKRRRVSSPLNPLPMNEVDPEETEEKVTALAPTSENAYSLLYVLLTQVAKKRGLVSNESVDSDNNGTDYVFDVVCRVWNRASAHYMTGSPALGHQQALSLLCHSHASQNNGNAVRGHLQVNEKYIAPMALLESYLELEEWDVYGLQEIYSALELLGFSSLMHFHLPSSAYVARSTNSSSYFSIGGAKRNRVINAREVPLFEGTVPAKSTIYVGPIHYSPSLRVPNAPLFPGSPMNKVMQPHNMLFWLRNNLTSIEPIWLTGSSITPELHLHQLFARSDSQDESGESMDCAQSPQSSYTSTCLTEALIWENVSIPVQVNDKVHKTFCFGSAMRELVNRYTGGISKARPLDGDVISGNREIDIDKRLQISSFDIDFPLFDVISHASSDGKFLSEVPLQESNDANGVRGAKISYLTRIQQFFDSIVGQFKYGYKMLQTSLSCLQDNSSCATIAFSASSSAAAVVSMQTPISTTSRWREEGHKFASDHFFNSLLYTIELNEVDGVSDRNMSWEEKVRALRRIAQTPHFQSSDALWLSTNILPLNKMLQPDAVREILLSHGDASDSSFASVVSNAEAISTDLTPEVTSPNKDLVRRLTYFLLNHHDFHNSTSWLLDDPFFLTLKANVPKSRRSARDLGIASMAINLGYRDPFGGATRMRAAPTSHNRTFPSRFSDSRVSNATSIENIESTKSLLLLWRMRESFAHNVALSLLRSSHPSSSEVSVTAEHAAQYSRVASFASLALPREQYTTMSLESSINQSATRNTSCPVPAPPVPPKLPVLLYYLQNEVTWDDVHSWCSAMQYRQSVGSTVSGLLQALQFGEPNGKSDEDHSSSQFIPMKPPTSTFDSFDDAKQFAIMQYVSRIPPRRREAMSKLSQAASRSLDDDSPEVRKLIHEMDYVIYYYSLLTRRLERSLNFNVRKHEILEGTPTLHQLNRSVQKLLANLTSISSSCEKEAECESMMQAAVEESGKSIHDGILLFLRTMDFEMKKTVEVLREQQALLELMNVRKNSTAEWAPRYDQLVLDLQLIYDTINTVIDSNLHLLNAIDKTGFLKWIDSYPTPEQAIRIMQATIDRLTVAFSDIQLSMLYAPVQDSISLATTYGAHSIPVQVDYSLHDVLQMANATYNICSLTQKFDANTVPIALQTSNVLFTLSTDLVTSAGQDVWANLNQLPFVSLSGIVFIAIVDIVFYGFLIQLATALLMPRKICRQKLSNVASSIDAEGSVSGAPRPETIGSSSPPAQSSAETMDVPVTWRDRISSMFAFIRHYAVGVVMMFLYFLYPHIIKHLTDIYVQQAIDKQLVTMFGDPEAGEEELLTHIVENSAVRLTSFFEEFELPVPQRIAILSFLQLAFFIRLLLSALFVLAVNYEAIYSYGFSIYHKLHVVVNTVSSYVKVRAVSGDAPGGNSDQQGEMNTIFASPLCRKLRALTGSIQLPPVLSFGSVQSSSSSAGSGEHGSHDQSEKLSFGLGYLKGLISASSDGKDANSRKLNVPRDDYALSAKPEPSKSTRAKAIEKSSSKKASKKRRSATVLQTAMPSLGTESKADDAKPTVDDTDAESANIDGASKTEANISPISKELPSVIENQDFESSTLFANAQERTVEAPNGKFDPKASFACGTLSDDALPRTKAPTIPVTQDAQKECPDATTEVKEMQDISADKLDVVKTPKRRKKKVKSRATSDATLEVEQSLPAGVSDHVLGTESPLYKTPVVPGLGKTSTDTPLRSVLSPPSPNLSGSLVKTLQYTAHIATTSGADNSNAEKTGSKDSSAASRRRSSAFSGDNDSIVSRPSRAESKSETITTSTSHILSSIQPLVSAAVSKKSDWKGPLLPLTAVEMSENSPSQDVSSTEDLSAGSRSTSAQKIDPVSFWSRLKPIASETDSGHSESKSANSGPAQEETVNLIVSGKTSAAQQKNTAADKRAPSTGAQNARTGKQKLPFKLNNQQTAAPETNDMVPVMESGASSKKKKQNTQRPSLSQVPRPPLVFNTDWEGKSLSPGMDKSAFPSRRNSSTSWSRRNSGFTTGLTVGMDLQAYLDAFEILSRAIAEVQSRSEGNSTIHSTSAPSQASEGELIDETIEAKCMEIADLFISSGVDTGLSTQDPSEMRSLLHSMIQDALKGLTRKKKSKRRPSQGRNQVSFLKNVEIDDTASHGNALSTSTGQSVNDDSKKPTGRFASYSFSSESELTSAFSPQSGLDMSYAQQKSNFEYLRAHFLPFLKQKITASMNPDERDLVAREKRASISDIWDQTSNKSSGSHTADQTELTPVSSFPSLSHTTLPPLHSDVTHWESSHESTELANAGPHVATLGLLRPKFSDDSMSPIFSTELEHDSGLPTSASKHNQGLSSFPLSTNLLSTPLALSPELQMLSDAHTDKILDVSRRLSTVTSIFEGEEDLKDIPKKLRQPFHHDLPSEDLDKRPAVSAARTQADSIESSETMQSSLIDYMHQSECISSHAPPPHSAPTHSNVTHPPNAEHAYHNYHSPHGPYAQMDYAYSSPETMSRHPQYSSPYYNREAPSSVYGPSSRASHMAASHAGDPNMHYGHARHYAETHPAHHKSPHHYYGYGAYDRPYMNERTHHAQHPQYSQYHAASRPPVQHPSAHSAYAYDSDRAAHVGYDVSGTPDYRYPHASEDYRSASEYSGLGLRSSYYPAYDYHPRSAYGHVDYDHHQMHDQRSYYHHATVEHMDYDASATHASYQYPPAVTTSKQKSRKEAARAKAAAQEDASHPAYPPTPNPADSVILNHRAAATEAHYQYQQGSRHPNYAPHYNYGPEYHAPERHHVEYPPHTEEYHYAMRASTGEAERVARGQTDMSDVRNEATAHRAPLSSKLHHIANLVLPSSTSTPSSSPDDTPFSMSTSNNTPVSIPNLDFMNNEGGASSSGRAILGNGRQYGSTGRRDDAPHARLRLEIHRHSSEDLTQEDHHWKDERLDSSLQHAEFCVSDAVATPNTLRYRTMQENVEKQLSDVLGDEF